jgi:hypothetical protein
LNEFVKEAVLRYAVFEGDEGHSGLSRLET